MCRVDRFPGGYMASTLELFQLSLLKKLILKLTEVANQRVQFFLEP